MNNRELQLPVDGKMGPMRLFKFFFNGFEKQIYTRKNIAMDKFPDDGTVKVSVEKLEEAMSKMLNVMTIDIRTKRLIRVMNSQKDKAKLLQSYYEGRLTSNPITWNNLKTTTFENHKGLLYYDKEIYPKSITIEMIDGMIWASLPRVPKRFFMSFIKNYHAFDSLSKMPL